MKINKWIIVSIFSLFLLVGCSEDIPKDKDYDSKDYVSLTNAMLLEISLLGEHKHITVRTIDEEIIEIKVFWDTMPTLKVGKQISSLTYKKEDQSLEAISLSQ